MCRLLFVIVIIAILAITAIGVVVVDQFGWRGFLVFAFALCVGLWLLKRSLPRILLTLFRRAMTRPLRAMGAVLRGYRVTVHSISICSKPSDFEADDAAEAIEDDEETERIPDELDWYRVEFTLAPPDSEPELGRIVVRPSWNPSMLGFTRPKAERAAAPVGLAGIAPFGLVDDVFVSEFEIWDGDEYVEPGEGVQGEQRICGRVGVGPDVRTIVLTYAHLTELGEIHLPRIDVKAEPEQ